MFDGAGGGGAEFCTEVDDRRAVHLPLVVPPHRQDLQPHTHAGKKRRNRVGLQCPQCRYKSSTPSHLVDAVATDRVHSIPALTQSEHRSATVARAGGSKQDPWTNQHGQTAPYSWPLRYSCTSTRSLSPPPYLTTYHTDRTKSSPVTFCNIGWVGG